MKYLLVLLFMFSFIKLNAATLYSRASGSWDTGTNWSTFMCGGGSCGCIPGNNDIVYICAGHTITLNSDLTIGSGSGKPLTIIVDGTLNLNNKNLLVRTGGTLTVNGSLTNVANVEFSNGSYVNFNSGSIVQIGGNLDNKNNSSNITFDGLISVGGNFTNGTGGVIGGQGVLSVSGNSSGSGTIFGQPTTGTNVVFGGTALPIELLYFTRDIYPDHVVLYWATATETNNEYFLVEKSSTGIDWYIIVKIDGSINSTNIRHYSYKDYNIENGIFYYRLTQVDMNGAKEIFDIISASIINRKERKVVNVKNVLGQDVDIEYNGFKIILYDDGSIEKRIN